MCVMRVHMFVFYHQHVERSGKISTQGTHICTVFVKRAIRLLFRPRSPLIEQTNDGRHSNRDQPVLLGGMQNNIILYTHFFNLRQQYVV